MGPPKIDNAPGLAWQPRKNGWVARWQCRRDIAKRAKFKPTVYRLWYGEEPDLTETDIAYIQTKCRELQDAMLVAGAGGVPQVMTFDGTFRGLIDAYQRDKDSPYRKLRYRTRVHYDTLCRRILTDFGNREVATVTARDILGWHEQFVAVDHIPMGHACVGMIRTILTFGSSILEDDDCARLRERLRAMRFQMGKPRNTILTADQVTAIRNHARSRGKPSIALAQAFQFDCMFRQRDVIGEWVPTSEIGPPTDVTWGNNKWWRGIRWEKIDQAMVLTHITSKRQKEVVIPLRLASMVLEELDLMFPGWNGERSNLPASGPIIVSELHGVPWVSNEYGRHWRISATACGVPKGVRNMDSRAGAITEATKSGAPLESIKQAATHSDIAMTQRYARGAAEKTEDVMRARLAMRNKKGA